MEPLLSWNSSSSTGWYLEQWNLRLVLPFFPAGHGLRFGWIHHATCTQRRGGDKQIGKVAHPPVYRMLSVTLKDTRSPMSGGNQPDTSSSAFSAA